MCNRRCAKSGGGGSGNEGGSSGGVGGGRGISWDDPLLENISFFVLLEQVPAGTTDAPTCPFSTFKHF